MISSYRCFPSCPPATAATKAPLPQLLAIWLPLAFVSFLYAEELSERFRPAAGANLPAPAGRAVEQEPLFRFVWISDMHLDSSRLELTVEAFHHIDQQLRPNFVMITGDNSAYAPPRPAGAESLSLRRQKCLKRFLGDHLQTPYVIIPGDNWPQQFDRVFGPMQYSFDYGGLHFIFLSIDRACHAPKTEGLAVLDDATWAWLKGDLERSRRKPVIVVQHEPIVPPTFLDAPRLENLLNRYPNVLAGFHGHLHAQLTERTRHRPYLVCPALGPNPHPAMQLVLVYREAIVLRTLEYAKTGKRFEFTEKRQEIPVPAALRTALQRPEQGPFSMKNYDAVAAHPHRNAPELAGRAGEFLQITQEYLLSRLTGKRRRLSGSQ